MSTTYRLGTLADSRAVVKVLVQSIADLSRRTHPESPWAHPEFAALVNEPLQPLYDHLARTAEYFWLAERDGQVVGYARSTRQDDVGDLTDFFVVPDSESTAASAASC